MSDVVDRLVDAYNSGDAAGFAALFTLDAKALEYPGVVAQNGRVAIEAYYRKRFAELPGLRTTVLHRIDLGRHVLDHEHVDRGDGTTFDTVAIYELRDGLIARIEIVREDRG